VEQVCIENRFNGFRGLIERVRAAESGKPLKRFPPILRRVVTGLKPGVNENESEREPSL
jgi:hypothetical protein